MIMRVQGQVFIGTRTPNAQVMSAFVRDVLGLVPATKNGTDFFSLPDGSSFAVTAPEELDPAERTVGLLVDDVVSAAAQLRGRGVLVSEAESNDWQRYVHFRAPDGQLYELVDNGEPQVAG
jgi:glyoxylase I family protein